MGGSESRLVTCDANSMIPISRARRLSYFGGRAESRGVWPLRYVFGGLRMTRVLLVGFDPATVDLSVPALSSGITAEKTSLESSSRSPI